MRLKMPFPTLAHHSHIRQYQQTQFYLQEMDMLILRILAVFMVLSTGSVLTGCNNDGPAESAGERIDNAADKTGDAIEEACEDATGKDCD
jgi:hypothetical protein